MLLAPPPPFPEATLAWARAWARRAPGRRAWGLSMCGGGGGAITSVSVTPPGCTEPSFVLTNSPWGVALERPLANRAVGDLVGTFPDLRAALLAVCPLSTGDTVGADREAQARG